MATVALIDAIERLDERKLAVIEARGSNEMPSEFVFPLLASGFDLDPDEMLTCARGIAAVTEHVNGDEFALGDVACQMWLDGLVTGLLFAEMRGSNVHR